MLPRDAATWRRRPALVVVATLLGVAVFTLPAEASRDGEGEGAERRHGYVPFQHVKEEIQGKLSQAADQLRESSLAQAEITRKVATHIGQYHTHVKHIASTMTEVMKAKAALSKAYHEDIKQGEESRIGALEVNMPEVMGEDFQLASDARFSARDIQDADSEPRVTAIARSQSDDPGGDDDEGQMASNVDRGAGAEDVDEASEEQADGSEDGEDAAERTASSFERGEGPDDMDDASGDQEDGADRSEHDTEASPEYEGEHGDDALDAQDGDDDPGQQDMATERSGDMEQSRQSQSLAQIGNSALEDLRNEAAGLEPDFRDEDPAPQDRGNDADEDVPPANMPREASLVALSEEGVLLEQSRPLSQSKLQAALHRQKALQNAQRHKNGAKHHQSLVVLRRRQKLKALRQRKAWAMQRHLAMARRSSMMESEHHGHRRHMHHVGKDAHSRRVAHRGGSGGKYKPNGWTTIAVQPRHFTRDRRWSQRHAARKGRTNGF